MKNKIILVFFLLLSNSVYGEKFCFSIYNSPRVLMVSADRDYLFYYPINKKINLEIKNREIFDDGGESRKITFSESYYEMIDGKKTGVYTFITQSGKIESANYFNFSSKKEIDFQRIFGSDYKDPNIVNNCY
ncbi:hypothetical protein HYE53_03950 [Aggregatibacter actinomycetemcomitans]|uniref:hypothetical protein n=1 Tax=Aggregatibacter actinomycetemcomitans TaxID=714 RepID=UPI00197B33D8|nr:hypothetical protein [Aggregatibacter actinomycetemcomitans]MBN6070262.1 hypothetical protein [Aggregatibacter actinomycetemcomitans]